MVLVDHVGAHGPDDDVSRHLEPFGAHEIGTGLVDHGGHPPEHAGQVLERETVGDALLGLRHAVFLGRWSALQRRPCAVRVASSPRLVARCADEPAREAAHGGMRTGDMAESTRRVRRCMAADAGVVAGVLCDLDGVLLDYHRAEQQAFAGVAMRLGLHDVDRARGVYVDINQALWTAYERGAVSADELRIRRWAQWLHAHDLDRDEAAGVSGVYLDLLTRSPAVMPGAVQALRAMTRRVPVVAVTNGFAEVAHGRLRASGILADLLGVVAADDVGAPKPDPAMFRAGLALLGDPDPATVVMIGDNHHADVVGAASVGLRTAWVAPEAVAEPEPNLADLRGPDLAAVVATLWPPT